MAPEPSAPATRRRPGQAREELLAAAQEVFTEDGYSGASLRQIAQRADTTQAMLYRHFSSKAALFEASVLEPFSRFVTELNQQWSGANDSALPNDRLIESFTTQVYDFASTHRRMMLTLISAAAFDDEALGDLPAQFAVIINRVVAQTAAQRADRGWDAIDTEVAVPVALAMMISTTLLERWFFAADETRPSRERIVTELVEWGKKRTGSPD